MRQLEWNFSTLLTPTQERRSVLLGRMTVLLGIFVLLFALALIIRTYMPCPFWDEWSEVNPIARGAGFTSWSWLWSQHNEHRLLIIRLLLLLDLRLFGGRNVSLLVELYLLQTTVWVCLALAIARFTAFSRSLKLTLQGLFGFCLFHPNQAENLTWPFQVSFILAFALATIAFLAIAFFERLRAPWVIAAAIGLTPFLAGLNLSGGLLIGPFVIAFAMSRHLPARYVSMITALVLPTTAAYLWGYHSPDPDHSPLAALSHPKDLFVYVLTYFGASWTRLVPHKERITAFLSLLCCVFLGIRAAKRGNRTSSFEWFCLVECAFTVAISFVTALGRLQLGVGQAFAGRYQTSAMLFWASLCALALIWIGQAHPGKFLHAQKALLLVLFLSTATFIPMWSALTRHGDTLRAACAAVMGGNHDPASAKLLYPIPQHISPAIAYLHHVWHE